MDENNSLTSIGLVNKQIEHTELPKSEDIMVIKDYTTSFRTSRISLDYYFSLKTAIQKKLKMAGTLLIYK